MMIFYVILLFLTHISNHLFDIWSTVNVLLCLFHSCITSDYFIATFYMTLA